MPSRSITSPPDSSCPANIPIQTKKNIDYIPINTISIVQIDLISKKIQKTYHQTWRNQHRHQTPWHSRLAQCILRQRWFVRRRHAPRQHTRSTPTIADNLHVKHVNKLRYIDIYQGLPTPVTTRVVHTEPGPMPTLTMSAPERINSIFFKKKTKRTNTCYYIIIIWISFIKPSVISPVTTF